MYNRFLFTFFLSLFLLSCNFSTSQNFNSSQTKILFDEFNRESQTPFSYKTLENFLKDMRARVIKKATRSNDK